MLHRRRSLLFHFTAVLNVAAACRIFFVFLIVSGTLIVINLFLAVISMGYEDRWAAAPIISR